MKFKRYISEGLAHYSYLIADQGQAAVIDPRRDIDAYLQDARLEEAQMIYVFETHRNEDYLIGSCEVEKATGAEIFHADQQWDYQYGIPSQDGQEWTIGRLKLRAIHTPGHTPGSMSYLLHDPDGNPWILFSGDTLFSGDAGRVDLLNQFAGTSADVSIEPIVQFQHPFQIETAELLAGGLANRLLGTVETIDQHLQSIGNSLAAELPGRPRLQFRIGGIETLEHHIPHRGLIHLVENP